MVYLIHGIFNGIFNGMFHGICNGNGIFNGMFNGKTNDCWIYCCFKISKSASFQTNPNLNQ